MASTNTYTNAGLAAAALIRSGRTNVYSLTCTNANAAVRYIQLHNKATVPLAGEVPVCVFTLPASGSQVIIGTDFFTNWGQQFELGVGFAFSTTLATYTAGTASDQFLTVHYA